MGYCGWTNSCTTWKSWGPVVCCRYRGIIVPGILGWCEMEFVHPQYVGPDVHNGLPSAAASARGWRSGSRPKRPPPLPPPSAEETWLRGYMGMAQSQTTRKPQVEMSIPSTSILFWVPIFDPHRLCLWLKKPGIPKWVTVGKWNGPKPADCPSW